MQKISEAIVNGGKLQLSELPFADGQRVRVVVSDAETLPPTRYSIAQVRRLLKGGVERFELPFDPMIPLEQWEMLK